MSDARLELLVIDSSAEALQATSSILRNSTLPVNIYQANSAKAALELLQQLEFDSVILDDQLDDADGLSLIIPIKQHRLHTIPIIMLSKLSDALMAANAIREGVFEFIPKDTLATQLVTAIEDGLRWANNKNILYEERKRFVELSNGLPQLVWTCTPEGECDFLNRRWAEYTGIAAEEQLGFKWINQIHPDDQAATMEAWSNSVKTNSPLYVRYRLRRHDGTYRLFDTRAMPHIDHNGKITRWLGSSTDITDTENARIAQSYLAAIVESSSDAIISKDLDDIVTSWNHSAQLLFGYTETEALGKKITDLIIPEDSATEESYLMEKLQAGTSIRAFETIRHTKDGRHLPVSLTFSAVKTKDGKTIGYAEIVRSISEKLAVESALFRSEERFRATFDSAPVGMALVSMEGIFIEANRALLELLECGFHQLRKLTQAEITAAEDQPLETLALKKLQAQQSPAIKFEKRIFTFYGREIPVLASVALLSKDDQPDSYLYQYVDLSERKQYETRLLQLAHYDPLTGLTNRAKFNLDIDDLLHQSRRNSTSFAVLFGDLDHFKDINDSLGHEAGDELLKTVADRLKNDLRHGDTVTRLGGDEFVILLSSVRNFEQVAGVANKLMHLVEEPIVVNKTVLHVGMSFGIALYPSDGDDAATLLRNADSALYDAKAKGRGCFSLYRKELTQYVDNRLRLDADLRRAIEEEQFELHFQPVISLDTNEVISAEALVRWNHPEKGQISPDDFIPYAQETGLILPLGDWILHEACRIAKSWELAGHALPVAVNVSARQFKDDSLLPTIKSALMSAKLERKQLHIEITEQLLLEDTEHNLAQIDAMKHHGLKIYLDDFGVGYSSLSYIIRFAPHFLKIDRSFVNKIGAASHHDAMVETIISLHNILPMEIIAEGVETNCQRVFLKDRGCNYAQGYFFSKPLNETDFMAFLQAPRAEYSNTHNT